MNFSNTGGCPSNNMAIKMGRQTLSTMIKNIKWLLGRSGILRPIAIFTPIEIDGTTVSMADLHNVSYIMDNDIQVGDTVTIYKANMIIPQIIDNISAAERHYEGKLAGEVIKLYHFPDKCPYCNTRLTISLIEPLVLACDNPKCYSEHMKQTH